MKMIEDRLDYELNKSEHDDEYAFLDDVDTRIFREILPAGILYTLGKRYYMTSPIQVSRSMGNDYPTYNLIPSEPLGSTPDNSRFIYSYPRNVVVASEFVIEYGFFDHKLLVWTGTNKLGEF